MPSTLTQRFRIFLRAMKGSGRRHGFDASLSENEAVKRQRAAIAELKSLAALQTTDEAVEKLNKLASNIEAAVASREQDISALTEQLEVLQRELDGLKTGDVERQKYQLVQTPFGSVVYALKENEQPTQPRLYFCEKCFNRGKISPLQPTTLTIRSRVTEKIHIERRCQVCSKHYGCEAQDLPPRR